MRARVALTASLSITALVAIFLIFLAMRQDAAIIGALDAAGTVTATLLAAVAALASMRAAAESRAAAERTQQAAARAIQPHLLPGHEPGRGLIRVTGAAAVNVNAVWKIEGAPAVLGEMPQIESGEVFELALPNGTVSMLWVDYGDASGTFRWQDTWDSDLRLLTSRLVN